MIGQRVQVYKNLHRSCWSVRAAGRVIGHVDTVTLRGAWVHVGAAAQQRIAAGGPRTVHAWVAGVVVASHPGEAWRQEAQRVSYRPHADGFFRFTDSGEVCTFSARVMFDEHGMWAHPYSLDGDLREVV